MRRNLLSGYHFEWHCPTDTISFMRTLGTFPTGQQRRAAVCLALLALTAMVAGCGRTTADDRAHARNWPGFLGPMGRAVATGRTVPASWDYSNRTTVAWRIDLDKHGYSSPIVWGNRVFVTQADQSADELLCVGLASGRQLWTVPVGPYSTDAVEDRKIFSNHMRAAPTPVTDGKYIYALFGSGELGCFDFSGKERWGKSLGPQAIDYGYASSPVLCDGKLIVQLEPEEGSFLLALDPRTGSEIWRAKRPDRSWATPVLYQYGKRKLLLCASMTTLSAHSLKDGRQLWVIDGCLSGEVGTSAAWEKDMVFVSSILEGVRAYRLGDVPEPVWHWDDGPTEMASPLAYDGRVYIVSQVGEVFCLDAATGSVKWSVKASDQFYATPVCVDGRVYAASRDGMIMSMMSGDDPGEVRRLPSADVIEATPAFVGGRVLIRAPNELICYEE